MSQVAPYLVQSLTILHLHQSRLSVLGGPIMIRERDNAKKKPHKAQARSHDSDGVCCLRNRARDQCPVIQRNCICGSGYLNTISMFTPP